MKKKVLILEPRGVEANVYDQYMSLPLMGPIYLGSILEQKGFEVRIFNENLVGRDISLPELDADFLLVSGLSCTIERGYDLAAMFKRRNPGGKVIVGGPHVSFMQEEAACFADHVVVGEGEEVIADLLRHGSDSVVVQGVSPRNLDALPLPNYRLLVGFERMKRIPIITSRGCPFDCEFCSVTKMFGRKYRMSSVERVLEELRLVGDVEVFFSDDNFTASPKHTHALLDEMGRRNIRPRQWSTQVRADVARDKDLVRKLRRLGCTRLYVGFESVSQRTLNAMNKKQNVDEMIHAIETFHAFGIRVHGMFILGNDGEDDDSVRETLQFINRHGIDSVQFMIITPFPGTDTFARMEREGRIMHHLWRYYDAMHVVFRPRDASPIQVQNRMLRAYREFYSARGALGVAAKAILQNLQTAGDASKRFLLRPTRMNAAIRLGGRFVLKKWKESNREYLEYLQQVSMATG